MHRIRFGDLTLVIIIGVFWGLNWPAVKFILSEIPPWSLRATGLSCGAILLAALAIYMGQSLRPARAERLPLVIAGLLSVLGFNILTAFGQLHTQTSTAVIIAFTMPMWTAVLSIFFLGERLTWRRASALAVGLAGLALLVSGDLSGFVSQPMGPLYMLGAAVSWAAGTVVLKSRTWSIKPIAQAAWMLGVSAPLAILAGFLTEYDGLPDLPSPAVLITMVYHILFPMVICYAAWSALVGRLPASVSAMGTLLVPVVGLTSATVLLGDALSWQKIVALTCVLLSIGLSFAKSNSPQNIDEKKL
ncbi:MAG: DMT family transporter [Alphaproteobacteria bacterium]|nr:DMT family transporter [Alphaproteobacteria bacterium]MBT4965041.1 DMT family transporter [Alphaproteobacteria bacterium]MBT5159577.1 DMT family transporter [Alphaproteobacteria bacterium]MBT7745396.1 DMT family transporter [Alphaproteobacteria bacterium]